MVDFCNRWEYLVNGWEHARVHAGDARSVTLSEAQSIVGYVYTLCGLPQRPPLVTTRRPDEEGYVKDAYAYVTHGGTLMVLQRPCTSSMLLHECAHLVTDDPLSELECRQPVEHALHGPVWLRNYLWLLGRLMGPLYNPFRLRATMPPELSPADIPHHPLIWGKPRGDLA